MENNNRLNLLERFTIKLKILLYYIAQIYYSFISFKDRMIQNLWPGPPREHGDRGQGGHHIPHYQY